MTVALPIIAFILLLLCFASRGMLWRRSFLLAAISWGVLLTFSTELLSLWQGINRLSLSLFWGTIALAALLAINRSKGVFRFARPEKEEIILLIPIGTILATTFLIAIVSPPNNWDSMTYHMGRVVHWIQNQSVANYPTHIIRQLYFPPWAEYAITHLQILSGDDYCANLVQWFAMVGSMVAVSQIAGQLGATNFNQIIAAGLVATIPMGILQASSTQNDYVASFWLCCFVHYGIQMGNDFRLRHAIASGTALGLAMLTKGTVYIFALPFIAWFIVSASNRYGGLRIIKPLVIITSLALALNASFYLRNYSLWGNPLSAVNDKGINEHFGIKTTISNLSRNLANNTWTTSPTINLTQFRMILAIHEQLKINESDPGTSYNSEEFKPRMLGFHEDFTGNGLHMLLYIILLPIIIFTSRNKMQSHYAAAALSAFVLFSALLKWQPWGVRLLLPYFVLVAPVIAISLPFNCKKWIPGSLIALLLLCSTPWLFMNESRPLIGDQTIFNRSRESQYFSSNPSVEEYYTDLANLVANQNFCRDVGLIAKPDAYEYPLWMLLKNRIEKLPRLEHINVENISGTIPLKDFKPCMGLQLIEP